MPIAVRGLTPAEKYYVFLDLVTPTNVLLVADLDTCLPDDLVARSWAQFQAARVLPRLRARADLTLVDVGTRDVDFVARQASSATWDDELGRQSAQPFGLDRPMRCLYLASPAEHRARIVLVGHHAVVDGRIGVSELQLFVRSLDGQAVPPQQQLSDPAPSAAERPWQSDRRALIALLREIAVRNAAAGPPEPRGWSRPGGPRRPRFVLLTVDPADAAGLLAGARAHHARAHGAIAAAWLIAAANRLAETAQPVLQLASPIDLAVPSTDPDRPSAPAVSVVAQRHRVSAAAPWELAREAETALRAALAQGEAELFFHLTRAAAAGDIATGTQLVAHALAAAPPAVAMSNMGVIDPGTDPEWLHSVFSVLAPAPNQIMFATALSYRGRLTHGVATDDSQLATDAAGAVVDHYRTTIRAMARMDAEDDAR